MPVAPSGPLSLSLSNLRDLVANCATFQSWVGVAGSLAAKAFVYLVAVPGPKAKRPFCVVHTPQLQEHKVSSTGWGKNHSYALTFEADVPEACASHDESALFDFCNKLGAIMEEMKTLEAASGVPTFSEIGMHEAGILRSVWEQDANEGEEDDAGDGDYMVGTIRLGWSL